MPNNPDVKYKVTATVISTQGSCAAGHRLGDRFPISCMNAGGLCGFFYHDLFPDLQTFEHGGKMPWWEADSFESGCPDPSNQVILRLEREKES